MRSTLLTLIISTFISTTLVAQAVNQSPQIEVTFPDITNQLSESEKDQIIASINEASNEVSEILSGLPEKIKVEVQLIDRDITFVDGVVGWAAEHKPHGKVMAQISTVYPGGVVAAVKKGMRSFIFHEFHHLTRGWSVYQNEFGPGINLAAINEGLAVVFVEEHTGVVHEVNAFPDDVHDWVLEILELPMDANYSEWVTGSHPDGRTSIGYRAGNYIIRKAMENSGKTVLELSELPPDLIFELAGY